MPSLYETLGLGKGADAGEIRKAYLKLSKTEHPDKGGSEERFKKISQAYEVLSDDQKRGYYDQTGQVPGDEAQVSGGGGGMPFPFDLGAMFGGMGFGGNPFGGMPFGGGQQMRHKRPKAPPKTHDIGLTLKDFFYGKKIQLKFERQKFCEQCKGDGSATTSRCDGCNGAGMQERHIMIGPGMHAVSKGPCGSCSGSGKKPSGTCSKCNGEKFSTHEKVLTVNIEPGMSPGENLTFPNECSDHPDFEQPGDVHIIMREADETTIFTRIGDELTTVINISLMESLLGCQRMLHGHPGHPKGLMVSIPAGTLRGDTITVRGEGMPRRGTTQRGNLQLTISMDLKQEDREILTKNADAIRNMFIQQQ
jgi:DnaJ-class molecular chaperone